MTTPLLPYSGTHPRNTDAKGRLPLPHEWFPTTEPVCLACAPDGTVIGFPARRLRDLSPAWRAVLLETLHVRPMDRSTRRVLIPIHLREWSGIGAFCNVAITGVGEAFIIQPMSRYSLGLVERIAQAWRGVR